MDANTLTDDWQAIGYQCHQCSSTRTVTRLRSDTVHFAEYRCLDCQSRDWIAKPGGTRRPSAHRKLVAKYSRGFCEMCLRPESDLPPNSPLEGHHVVEYQADGESERENVWIICRACHRLVTWMRTYHGEKA